ncbi:hypothetical protein SCP_0603950 [Sparassis crispa]|uniref:Uncharacterized protein n=1 Tax=Sparassis crispa TaxID=139825 RepID=A0A401GQB6_9APHY|nr:hypothetical protein SCP_0603950 [Sparassis crispa]GBE84416.1 hypothetical protein SCP_0603950 [Sparassis crispa]
MPPSPSTILTDALSSLSKATSLALATAEEQARGELERADAEVAEACEERDNALKTLRTLELGEKDWQRRAEGWKAAVDKSELTIKHQAETITHLRAEVQQWKTQLTRLEEASRQELLDWKEQYLLVEEERCRLSSRIDELVAEQLAWNTQANATLTPKTHPVDLAEPSAVSTTTKRSSTSSNTATGPYLTRKGTTPRIPPDTAPRKSRTAVTPSKPPNHDPMSTQPSKRKLPADSASTASKATPRAITRDSGVAFVPRQQILRRHVRAVIEVPVKEEEDSEEQGFASDGSYASGSAYEPEESTTPITSRTTRPQRMSVRKGVPRSWGEDEGEESDYGSNQVRGRLNHRPRRRMPEDDDIDELAMSAEDDATGCYVAQPVASSTTKARGNQRNTAPAQSSAKKRKLDNGVGTAARSATAKVSRKR